MLPIPLPWLIIGVMVSLFGTYRVYLSLVHTELDTIMGG